MSIIAKQIAQVNAATPVLNGDGILRNLLNNERCTVRIVQPSGYHHSDFEPKTITDAHILLRWSGGRAWSWNFLPATLQWGNNITACTIHTFPHGDLLYGRFSFSIFNDKALRLNATGHHFCCHYINTKDVRWRTSQTNPSWWNQSPIMVNEAVRLANGNKPQPIPQSPVIVNPTHQPYRVVARDTLSLIAKNFGVSLPELKKANPQITDPNRINVGDIINIPTISTQPPVASGRTVFVTSGMPYNTLTRIANSHGFTLGCLLMVNPEITDPNRISVGQAINIPKIA